MAEEDLKRLIEESAAKTQGQFERLEKRFDGVEKRLDGVDKRFDGVENRFDGVEKRLDGVDKRLNGVDTKIDDTRRHFEIIAEGLDSKIQFVAETFAAKLDKETASIREEMRGGFAETQAMIKFSYSDLDRRIRTLEGTVSSLESRVERLEGSGRPS